MENFKGFTPHLELEKVLEKMTILLVKFKNNISEHRKALKLEWGLHKTVTTSRVVNEADRLLSVDRLFKKTNEISPVYAKQTYLTFSRICFQ